MVDGIEIEHASRINYSLIHAGLTSVIRRMSVPAEIRGGLQIPPFSDEIPVAPGTCGDLSPRLHPEQFARLSAPVIAQLVLAVAGRGTEAYPVSVSPLCAWDRRREHAAATAAFVLENDRVVAELVRRAGTGPEPSGSRPPVEETAERLYNELMPFFGPCYQFERTHFPPDEQAVRFPLQMKYDLGGTCIDLALAYAAALLRSGASPLLLLVGDEHGPRHALVGLWLMPRPVPRPTVPDGRLLEATRREGAWVPVEVTGAWQGAVWEEARQKAQEQVSRAGILWGVDVAAARAAGLGSLPEQPCATTFHSWDARILDERTRTMTEVAEATLKGLHVEVVASGHPADEGKGWELSGFRARIGRGRHHEIGLVEPTVSDPHAVILVEEGEIRLENLFAKNPVWVEDERVPPGAWRPLRPGQAFRVGAVTLRLAATSERRSDNAENAADA